MKPRKRATPEQLRRMRERVGLSQEGMAGELGVSERFLLYRERGDRPIPKWLEYSVRWLLHIRG